MDRKQYLDFELNITKPSGKKGSYRVRVGDQGKYTAWANFSEPQVNLAGYRRDLAEARSGGRHDQSSAPVIGADPVPAEQVVKRVGQTLFEDVFQRDVWGELAVKLAEAQAQGKGVRLRITVDEYASQMEQYPWECLWKSSEGLPFAIDVDTPVVRSTSLPVETKPLAVAPPLRVLVMTANPNREEWLKVEEEWTDLKAALDPLTDRIALRQVDRATLDHLDDALLHDGPWHIFHFMGHGKFDLLRDKGYLLMEDGAGQPDLVDVDRLMAVIGNHDSLRLVVLNACEGASGSPDNPFAGVAQGLIKQGVPGVVAMQAPISDRAARRFAENFYPALARGASVEEAVTLGRRAIWTAGNKREWGTPVLYLRTPDGYLFEVETGRPPPKPPIRGQDLELPLSISFREAILGAEKRIQVPVQDVCERCGGIGTESERQSIPCSLCRGRKWLQRMREIGVLIPPGSDSGTAITLTGEGGLGAQGGSPGDVHLTMQVREDRRFRRQGNDILSTVLISEEQATEGARITVDRIDGTHELVIPPGTKHNQQILVSGEGVPEAESNRRGDMYVTIQVATEQQFSPCGSPLELKALPDLFKLSTDCRLLVCLAPTDSRAEPSSCGNIQLHDAQTGTLIGVVASEQRAKSPEVAFSPGGHYVACTARVIGLQRINIYDVSNGQEVLWLSAGGPFSGDFVAGTLVYPTNDWLYGVQKPGERGVVMRWNLHTAEGTKLVKSDAVVTALAGSRDGRLLAGTTVRPSLDIWRADSGMLFASIPNVVPGRKVTFSPSSRLVASDGMTPAGDSTASGVAPVLIVDATTGRELRTVQGTSSPVAALTFSSDDSMLVTGHLDGGIAVWDVASGRQIQSLTGHDPVSHVAFQPDGKLMVIRRREPEGFARSPAGGGLFEITRLQQATEG